MCPKCEELVKRLRMEANHLEREAEAVGALLEEAADAIAGAIECGHGSPPGQAPVWPGFAF